MARSSKPRPRSSRDGCSKGNPVVSRSEGMAVCAFVSDRIVFAILPHLDEGFGPPLSFFPFLSSSRRTRASYSPAQLASRMCRMMGVVSRGPVYYDLFEEFADLATQGMCPIGAPDGRGRKDSCAIQQDSTSPPMYPTWQSPFGVLPLGRRSRSSRKWGLVVLIA